MGMLPLGSLSNRFYLVMYECIDNGHLVKSVKVLSKTIDESTKDCAVLLEAESTEATLAAHGNSRERIT